MNIKRGFCGIGIVNGKKEQNLGTLWRSAFCLGASFIFTVGTRYQAQRSDTPKAWRHLPYYHYEGWSDFTAHLSYDTKMVAVEITPSAVDICDFIHPERCVYILGPEDGSLSEEILQACDHIIKIDSLVSLNVASTGTICLFDRQQKSKREGK